MSSESIPLPNGRLPIMVVSHERSGTHFTMNALASCFGYVSNPWIDIDRHQFNINYFHAPSLKTLLLNVAGLRARQPGQEPSRVRILQAFRARRPRASINIVYVYRNPADVMSSFWRFLHTWDWVEGPTVDTALGFATAAPMGQLMRYQFRQYPPCSTAGPITWSIGSARQSARTTSISCATKTSRSATTTPSCVWGGVSACSQAASCRRRATSTSCRRASVKFAPGAACDNRDAVAELALQKFPALMDRLGYGSASVIGFRALARRPQSSARHRRQAAEVADDAALVDQAGATRP